MWVSAPNCLDCAAPELTVITGMPAFSARATTAFIASGLASVTIRPSTCWSIAACTSCACWSPWSLLEYRKLMLSFCGGLLGAALHDVPEGVAGPGVGDHGELPAGGVHGRAVRGELLGPVLRALAAGGAAPGQAGRAEGGGEEDAERAAAGAAAGPRGSGKGGDGRSGGEGGRFGGRGRRGGCAARAAASRAPFPARSFRSADASRRCLRHVALPFRAVLGAAGMGVL